MNYIEMEKCTVSKRRGDRCVIKCKLGLWSVEGPYGLALINEANHYFQQYKEDGEYDKLLGAFEPKKEDKQHNRGVIDRI